MGQSWGSFLFVIYMNDMEISVCCKLLIYGDDITLLVVTQGS